MKLIFFLPILLFHSISYSQKELCSEFILNLKIQNGNEKKLYIRMNIDDSWKTVDSVVLSEFPIVKKIKAPFEPVRLILTNNIASFRFLANCGINILYGNYDSLQRMTIEDNGESEYELLYEKRISQPTRKMLIQLDISHQHKNMDSIMRLYDSTMVAFNSMTRQFIRNFSTKFISLDLLNYNKNVWPTDTIKTLYEHLDKRLKDFPSAKKTVNFISTTLGTRVRPFPIDSLTGRGYVNEKQNKIYLVDFWGTWCQPCLNNIPALKKYYEKYHAKGCEIISIACERDTLDYVFNAKIKKLGLPWPVFKESMKSMVDSGFFEKYNIIGYPTYLLLDNTGKIIFHFTGEDHFKDVVERTKLTLDAR